jgi:hypothetical protein
MAGNAASSIPQHYENLPISQGSEYPKIQVLKDLEGLKSANDGVFDSAEQKIFSKIQEFRSDGSINSVVKQYLEKSGYTGIDSETLNHFTSIFLERIDSSSDAVKKSKDTLLGNMQQSFLSLKEKLSQTSSNENGISYEIQSSVNAEEYKNLKEVERNQTLKFISNNKEMAHVTWLDRLGLDTVVAGLVMAGLGTSAVLALSEEDKAPAAMFGFGSWASFNYLSNTLNPKGVPTSDSKERREAVSKFVKEYDVHESYVEDLLTPTSALFYQCHFGKTGSMEGKYNGEVENKLTEKVKNVNRNFASSINFNTFEKTFKEMSPSFSESEDKSIWMKEFLKKSGKSDQTFLLGDEFADKEILKSDPGAMNNFYNILQGFYQRHIFNNKRAAAYQGVGNFIDDIVHQDIFSKIFG